MPAVTHPYRRYLRRIERAELLMNYAKETKDSADPENPTECDQRQTDFENQKSVWVSELRALYRAVKVRDESDDDNLEPDLETSIALVRTGHV